MERLLGSIAVMIQPQANGNLKFIPVVIAAPDFKELVACAEIEAILQKVRMEEEKKNKPIKG